MLQQFDISDFEVLDDSPLIAVVGKLRAVEGGEWHESDNAFSDISVCGAMNGPPLNGDRGL